MFNSSLNFNFNKNKDISDFSKKLYKYEHLTMKYRNKILNCKKCGKDVQTEVNNLIQNCDKSIVECEKYLLKQIANPFNRVVQDPTQIINSLKIQKDNIHNYLFGIDVSELCWKCKHWHNLMMKNYGKYKNLNMVLDKLGKGEK